MIDGQNMHDLLQVMEVANAHDQIAFDAFHSFLMEAQMKLATYVQFMRNSILKIRIAGSSCHPQKYSISKMLFLCSGKDM